MALRVWLPLNGNINNYGISDVVPINIGSPSFSSSGKIGKAIQISSDGQAISLPNYMSQCGNYVQYSMCAWIYLDSTATNHSASILSSGNWNSGIGQCCFALYSYGSNGYTKLLVPNSNGWSDGINLTTPITLNKWYHIAITCDGSKTYGYINGEYIGSYNGGKITSASESSNLYIGAATYYSGFTLKGKINDVRIYDHCLSIKEVKEISKGLCLHYKLDGVCNTIDSTEWDCSGFGNNGTKNGSITTVDSGGRYSKAYNFNGNLSNYISATVNNLVNVINSQQLTVSYWCYDTNSGGSTNACPVCIGSAAAQNKLLLLHANAAYGIGLCFYSNDLWNTSTKLTPNTWNLLTFVINNGIRSIYLNGNKISSATYSSNLSVGTPLILGIGKDPIRNSYQLSGSISDLRIYATPLSDADIKELYNTSASVDNFGNVYGYEFVEEIK